MPPACISQIRLTTEAATGSRFEKEIKQAAEDGDRGVLLCYMDCCSNAHAALAVLEGRGFTIVRRSENIGGVMQHPAYYAEW